MERYLIMRTTKETRPDDLEYEVSDGTCFYSIVEYTPGGNDGYIIDGHRFTFEGLVPSLLRSDDSRTGAICEITGGNEYACTKKIKTFATADVARAAAREAASRKAG